MGIIYDVLLNFNEELIEYFEWEDNDNVKYIKRVSLFKVNTSFLNDIVNYETVLDNSFVNKIPKYDIGGTLENGHVCLFTDGDIAIGVFIMDNKPILFSRLLLDEEFEVLEVSLSLEVLNISYTKLNMKNKSNSFLTRSERSFKENLSRKLDDLYKNKSYEELIYLYYEYTNSENRNISYIYNFLKNSLNDFNEKHFKLLDIVSMVND